MNHAIAKLTETVGADVVPLILAKCVQELGRREQEVLVAMESEDAAALGDMAHAVKSVARTVGLIDLADLAAQIETDAREGSPASALGAASRFREQLSRGRQDIEEYQQGLNSPA